MTRYLLDTNIISNLVKPAPSPSLLAWMEEQEDEALFVAAMTIAELWQGVRLKPAGRKRLELETWFGGPKGPPAMFAGRILPFDERAGLIWARLMAEGFSAGCPRNSLDMIIAATAEAASCVIVTDNERDFLGLGTVNPMRW